MKKSLFTVMVMLPLCSAVRADITILEDSSLSEVQGQDGITLGLEMYLNIDAPATAPKVSTLDSSTTNPSTFPSTCSGNGNKCTLAFQIENRAGEWLVLKDSYAALRIFSFNLDGSLISDATYGGGADTPSYFDAGKFKDATGSTCLLPSGVSCSVAGVGGLNALSFSYPSRTASYNTATGVSSGYNSFQLALNVGRMAVQYDTTAGDNTGYSPAKDTGQSFMGIKVTDNNTMFAGAAIKGRAIVYGF